MDSRTRPKSPFSNSVLALIGLSSVFSVGMLGARILLTHSNGFQYLAWNLILAWIPLGLSVLLWRRYHRVYEVSSWLMSLVWLLFLPNTFYILTDLSHLQPSAHPALQVGFWFDLIMVLSFAWNGLILGLLSVKVLHDLLDRYWDRGFGWTLVQAVLALVAVGVYFGRFLRLNSWDVLAHPTRVLSAFISLGQQTHTYLLVGCFYVLFALIYATFRTLGTGQPRAA